MTEHDHPFDLDEMDRDPLDYEIESLNDHQLAELFRDVAEGAGSLDLYDRLTQKIVRRFDEAEAEGQVWIDAGSLQVLMDLAELDLMNDAFDGRDKDTVEQAFKDAQQALPGGGR